MKKVILGIISAIILCTCVQAQDEANINPITIARAFALKSPAYYKVNVNGRSGIQTQEWVDYQLVLRKSDFAITEMTINGIKIELEEPVYGIPIGKVGVLRQVSVNVSAYTSSDEFAGHGHEYRPEVSANESIVVTLQPDSIRQEIAVENLAKYGNDIDLEIDNAPYGYGYGVSDGKLYVYLPPVGGKYHYIVRRRSDGTPIAEGWIESFKDSQPSGNTAFGVKLLGNVMGADFQRSPGYEDWITLSRQSMDCAIPTSDGGTIFGKVFYTDVGTGGLEVSMDSKFGVQVYSVIPDKAGNMQVVPMTDLSNSDDSRFVSQQLRLGKVVVVVYPLDGNNDSYVWIYLHRFYTPPSSGGSGGNGKGVAKTISEI